MFAFVWVIFLTPIALSSLAIADEALTSDQEQRLLGLLGEFPQPPSAHFERVDSLKLDSGWRHKIEFVSEDADTLFDSPVDKIGAYLFVPEHDEGEKMPAIVAIHQDGPRTHLGKSEPAGLAGDVDQHFGLELFERGYVVICPDRLGHAERRRIPNPEAAETDFQRDLFALSHWGGQLLMAGRSTVGKEVYDLMRSADILFSLDYVDATNVGAIGHSAGGYMLVYFMFADERIKVGASSCGFFELVNFFNEHSAQKRLAISAIPGLARVGKSADYLAHVAPRPVLMTRGLWEWGTDGEWGEHSKAHVEETRVIENHARDRYSQLNASDNLKVIYFDEGGGNHAFPPNVKEEAYQWLDGHLKPN